MNKKEYLQAKEAIVKEYGSPLYELNQPMNESAVKLNELRLGYTRFKQDVKKTKRLAEQIKSIFPEIKAVPIPEQIINPVWLAGFTDSQKAVVQQWMKDTNQSLQQISKSVGSTIQAVRATLSLEEFGLLRLKLAVAWKNVLPLESMQAVHQVLQSDTPNAKLAAARLILVDSGIIKQDSMEEPIKNELSLDKETIEELRKLGDKLI